MRNHSTNSLFLIIGLFVIGFAFIVIATFAYSLGIDHDVYWEFGCFAILFAGILMLFVALSFYLFPSIFFRLVENNVDISFVVKIFKVYLFTIPVVLFILAIYVWFISAGLWTTWPSRTNYYALQAEGFQNGTLYLPITPRQKLLDLTNPYDPKQREIIQKQGVKIPVDFSLYDGKFYLYWGPVPALLINIFNYFISSRIEDIYLLFVFTCGLFLFLYLFVLFLWDRFFPNLPKWTLVISIFTIGLMCPIAFFLNHPLVYEVSIAGAQFFFIGGLLLSFHTLYKKPIPSRLLVVGIMWALAIGTRQILVIPILFMIVVLVYRFFRNNPFIQTIIYSVCLGLPLLICAVSLGWYNWARFGSVLESGLYYQLAMPNLQENYNILFSPNYIFQNLYNYSFNPFNVIGEFPYIFPKHGNFDAILPFYSLLDFYTGQPLTGLFYCAPYTIFALIPMFSLILKKNSHNSIVLDWTLVSLIGSFILSFLLVMMFFWSSMRYIFDFIPALVLLSVIGFWQGYNYIFPKTGARILYSYTFNIMLLYSIIVNALLAISGNLIRLRVENPELLNWLIEKFPNFG